MKQQFRWNKLGVLTSLERTADGVHIIDVEPNGAVIRNYVLSTEEADRLAEQHVEFGHELIRVAASKPAAE